MKQDPHKLPVQNKGTKKLFDNPILERLTRTHISVPLIILDSAAVGLLIWGFVQTGVNPLVLIGLFLLGVLTFTFIEYLVHRYVFHMLANSDRKREIQYTIHGVHHEYPKDKDRLAMPPVMSTLITVGLFYGFGALMGDLVYGFLPGFLVGYTLYLGVHYMVHAYQPPRNFWKVFWVHHGIHHYKEPERAFGVSSPLWDLILGSMPQKK